MTTDKRIIWQDLPGFEKQLAAYQEVCKDGTEFIAKCKEHGVIVTPELWKEYIRLRSCECITPLIKENIIRARWEVQNYHAAFMFSLSYMRGKADLLTLKGDKVELAENATQRILNNYQLIIETPAQEQTYELCRQIETAYKALAELIGRDQVPELVIPTDEGGVNFNWPMINTLK